MPINAKPRGYLFEEVPDDNPERSAFDLSYRSVLSADFDYLYPIMCEEVLPNTDYELGMNAFMRTAPLVAPVFQDIDVKFYHFWTPTRIIFRKWKKLISNGDGSVSIADALAAKKLVDMPFITNYDLAQRGNFSFTDPYGVRAPRVLSTSSPVSADYGDSRDIFNFRVNSQFLLDGESRGSLADYLGIADTKISCTYTLGRSITTLEQSGSEYNPFELKAYLWNKKGEGDNIQEFVCADGINFGGVTISEAWRNDISLDWQARRNGSFGAFALDDINYGSIANQKSAANIRLHKNLRTYCSLPFRAYNKIYYDWFRDENLQPLTDYSYNSRYLEYMAFWRTGTGTISTASSYQWNTEFMPVTSVQTVTNYLWSPDLDYYNADPSISASWDNQLNVGLLRKSFQKDYLTSALPTPQRGADVVLPVSGKATITTTGEASSFDVLDGATLSSAQNIRVTSSANGVTLETTATSPHALAYTGNNLNIDLSNVNSLTIEALRVANKLQQFLEKFARTGSRYVEMMLSHFDVLVPDAASERPTLLNTSRIPIQISANSSESAVQIGDEVTPQGTQTGQAMSNGNTGYRFHADEHGFLMTIMCIEPRTFYGSSLHRMWLRRGWLDFAWPKFANLGEQSVYNCEVFPTIVPRAGGVVDAPDKTQYDSTLSGADAYNMGTFGYQSRYCEYKYHQDEIHGDFRHSLDHWTLARFPETASFDEPKLNAEFIKMNVLDRQNIFHTVSKYEVVNTNIDSLLTDAVYSRTWNDHFYFDFRINFKAIKPLPLFGVPTL